MADPYEVLIQRGFEFPHPSGPKGSYVPLVENSGMAYISGNLPITDDGGLLYPGICGDGVDVEQATEAAQLCALHIIARLHEFLGSLEKVERIVKLTGFVASTAGFKQHPTVINGASDLFRDVFGERGLHARSAVGVASLPLGSCVEIEAIVQSRGQSK